MSDQPSIYNGLMQLVSRVEPPRSSDDPELESVLNSYSEVDYCARLTAPVFTSLCPFTRQPDFVRLAIGVRFQHRVLLDRVWVAVQGAAGYRERV